MMRRYFASIEEAFWSRIYDTREGVCWNWMGTRLKGYGRFGFQKRTYRAHVVSYTLHHGPVGPGQVVRHRCDNPACVNPAHLELGTHADNVADRVERGRSASGARNGKAKLTPEAVQIIRTCTGPRKPLARAFGVDETLIGKVRRGELWS